MHVFADGNDSEEEETPKKARSTTKSARKSAQQAGLRFAIACHARMRCSRVFCPLHFRAVQLQTSTHPCSSCHVSVVHITPSPCSTIPAEVDALAGRLTVALELLAQLLGAVQLQPSIVIPLLRTVSQVLTVQGLNLLQVKALGVAPFLHLHADPRHPQTSSSAHL